MKSGKRKQRKAEAKRLAKYEQKRVRALAIAQACTAAGVPDLISHFLQAEAAGVDIAGQLQAAEAIHAAAERFGLGGQGAGLPRA